MTRTLIPIARAVIACWTIGRVDQGAVSGFGLTRTDGDQATTDVAVGHLPSAFRLAHL